MQDTTVSNSPRAIRIGCSGWNYKHWRGAFYPDGLPMRRWFEFYAAHFDTVEINNSFYRLPPPATFDKWREQAPEGFCYAVKANRFITQAKKLLDPEEPLERMMTSVRHLGDRTGPILYQLPPSLKRNLERLERFLQALPSDAINVFEFRDPSWYVPLTYELLDRHGASICAHDMRGSATERIAVGPVAYVRFHGGVGKYWGRYADEQLHHWAEWMLDQASNGRTVWAYFNNDIHAHAIADARTLKSVLDQVRH
ncbi:DUF72 domain-containing protein [Sphingomonas daechungensis]|uniref:DUF72 domain-containing protein n=1 Tax=Sphingomonas daechungensis TaxID=1176646 RepID=A0ABX6T492_9SPHN|nr:DUF72 domain-containing protein [Sphingomonas daechungensis]QNP42468.1 DUF72 domain-containing protein [Sphingomonas daechungensis]